MARDGLFFRGAARVHARHRTPAAPLLLHGLVDGVLALTGTLQRPADPITGKSHCLLT